MDGIKPKMWSAPAGSAPGRGCRLSPQRRRPVVGDPEFGKRTYKPNSVVCGHSSRRRVAADAHQRPTRRFRRPADGSPLQGWGIRRSFRAAWARRADAQRRLAPGEASLPIWSCSVWGLPCLRRYRRSGALLPHHFTLTPRTGLMARSRGGMFSVALAVHGF